MCDMSGLVLEFATDLSGVTLISTSQEFCFRPFICVMIDLPYWALRQIRVLRVRLNAYSLCTGARLFPFRERQKIP